MEKIGIILTSIEKNKALFESIASILKVLQPNWQVIIGYQGKDDSIVEFSHPQIFCYRLPYNCGLCFARNDMIEKALGLGCEFTLLSADSILFNESMKDIDNLLPCFQKSDREAWNYYDLIGLSLSNRIPWEGQLSLIPNQHFEIDFIEKNPKEGVWVTGDKVFNIWDCSIVRNFWLARTKTLLDVGYHNELVMMEHEDFFIRYQVAGYKVGCTNLCGGTYKKATTSPEYDKIREENMRIGRQRLLKKYNLKKWVEYKHFERIQSEK
jgi:glycosyltransferase involved in cell wall biosynthesis